MPEPEIHYGVGLGEWPLAQRAYPPPCQGARSVLEREIVTMKMPYGLVRVKAARSNGKEVNPASEFEDAAGWPGRRICRSRK